MLHFATVTPTDGIRKKLLDAKVNPAALARAIQKDRSTASLILNGKRGIPAKHYAAIADLLGTSVPALFAPNDPPRHDGALHSETPNEQNLQGQESANAPVASSRVAVSLIAELAEAAEAFRRLSNTCTAWATRLDTVSATIGAAHIERVEPADVRGQIATTGADPSVRPAGTGTDRGSTPRQRTKRRA